ncbi:MAG: hypothetical protein H6634_12605 [Anaerolineales bacterium]|nr:hypothetical protein [Anaerolineales bacterium]MCB9112074.1 hypothetical protein [Anaerolineales bacterium]
MDNKVIFGALIFIAMVVGANLVMYAIVRGVTRPGGGGFWQTIAKSLDPNQNKKQDDMEELHRTLQGLTGEKKENPEDSD